MRVPEAQISGVTRVQNLPDARINVPTNAETFLNSTDQMGLRMGENMANAAEQLAVDHIVKAQNNLDDAAFSGAQTATSKWINGRMYGDKDTNTPGYLSSTGKSAFDQDPNGKTKLQTIGDDYQQFISQQAAGLRTDEQKAKFKAWAANIGTHAIDNIGINHQLQQTKQYQLDSYTGVINQAKQDSALNFNNQDSLAGSVDRVYANARKIGELQGKPPEWIDAYAQSHASDLLTNAAMAALQRGDYQAADSIARFGGEKGYIQPNDLRNLDTHIGDSYASQVDPLQGLQATEHKLKGDFPKLSFEQTKALRDQLESGGKDFNADGTDVAHVDKDGVSSRFKNQVRDDVAANPGFGIAPAKSRTPEEYNRVGDQLLKAHYDAFGGDTEKALRAYNGGRGGMDKADGYIERARGLLNKTGTPFDNMTLQDVRKWNIHYQSAVRQQQSQLAVGLKNDVDNQYASASNTGQTGAIIPFERFAGAYGDKAQEAYANYRDQIAHAGQYFAIKDLPIDQAMATLEAAKPKGAENAEREWQQYNNLVTQFNHAQNIRKKDPMQYAEQQGLSKPLDLQKMTPQDLMQREHSALQMAHDYGTPFALFTKAQASQLTQEMNDGTTEQKINTLKNISNGLSSQAYGAALQQIRPDSPATQIAGHLIGMDRVVATAHLFGDTALHPFGANEVRGVTGEEVARTILRGEQILNPTKQGNKENGKASNVSMPNKFNEAVYGLIGDSYNADPQTETAIISAARAYYAAKMDKSKESDGGMVNPDLLKEAVDAVTGGTATHADKIVIPPYGMPEDKFLDAAKQQFTAQVGSELANQFDKLPMIPAGYNRYYLQGSSGIVTKAGKPVVLDFNQ